MYVDSETYECGEKRSKVGGRCGGVYGKRSGVGRALGGTRPLSYMEMYEPGVAAPCFIPFIS